MNQEKSNRIKIIVKIVSFVLVTIALIGVVTLFLHPEHAARYSDERLGGGQPHFRRTGKFH